MIRANVELLAFLVGTAIPLIVGAVADSKASSSFKAGLNVILAGVTGFLSSGVSGGGLLTTQAAVAACTAVVTSWGAYQGWLKHTSLPTSIAAAIPGGLGTPTAQP